HPMSRSRKSRVSAESNHSDQSAGLVTDDDGAEHPMQARRRISHLSGPNVASSWALKRRTRRVSSEGNRRAHESIPGAQLLSSNSASMTPSSFFFAPGPAAAPGAGPAPG